MIRVYVYTNGLTNNVDYNKATRFEEYNNGSLSVFADNKQVSLFPAGEWVRVEVVDGDPT